MTTTTYVEDREHHYIDTMREVTILSSVDSAKAFLESEAGVKSDGRAVGYNYRDNELFITFDGKKPNAWTDAVNYKYEVI